MRSDLMKSGVDRIPHRALFRALGLTDIKAKFYVFLYVFIHYHETWTHFFVSGCI